MHHYYLFGYASHDAGFRDRGATFITFNSVWSSKPLISTCTRYPADLMKSKTVCYKAVSNIGTKS